MKWSPQQDAALKAVKRWHRGGDSTPQVMTVFGVAGTGKTTLARHFAQGVDGLVLGAAYTGKAALVMRQAGFAAASTLHRLLYHSNDRGQVLLRELRLKLHAALESGHDLKEPELAELQRQIRVEEALCAQPRFTLNTDSSLRGAALLVVDEVSFVDRKMAEDLLSFGCKVLVLGDPAQLPPVLGEGYFTAMKPDVMLTEVHRQARDNPIIELATRVRCEDVLRHGTYGESRVIPRMAVTQDVLMSCSQAIVGRNLTRHNYNAGMRQILGRESWQPIKGDRLVCLRNNHDRGLLNGAIFGVDEVIDVNEDMAYMHVRADEEGAESIEVAAHAFHLRGETTEPMPYWERCDAEEFAYGYALTCHKAQGSQWPSVYVLDESHHFGRNANRWLYTAITRAQERLTLVTG